MRNLFATQRGFVFVLAIALLAFGLQDTSHGQGGRKIYWAEWKWETEKDLHSSYKLC